MDEKPFKAVKRSVFLEKAFELFSSKTIDAVKMQNVADASGYGIATLYRYFNTKLMLVVAVFAWKWDEYLQTKQRPESDDLSAAQHLRIYLESFVDLYRNHKDLLCFTQYFNIYIRSEEAGSEAIEPVQTIIRDLEARFHEIYKKAVIDHTIRTDIPEKVMFSTTIHLMLAAATRYAVGLIYMPEESYDPEAEMLVLRDALLEKYLA